ncbi:MAG: hypothetical protein OXT74_14095, partial [Candidatus Poribacteria bacterium]|nr:hypothetical protein [Candidatus Poribacteria bacterium]
LYVSGECGIARWNEDASTWEYLPKGFPSPDKPPAILNLVVHRGRLFAGLRTHGVYLFDTRTQTWRTAGLEGFTVYGIVSHQSSLYAAAGQTDKDGTRTIGGIYRTTTIAGVHPHAKAAATWGRLKRGGLAK